MFNKLININTGEKNMSEQKKFEGYTDGQMAREIMMNALAEALDTNTRRS